MAGSRGRPNGYAKALPFRGWPPFSLCRCAIPSNSHIRLLPNGGKAYLPFPDPRTFRISMNNRARQRSERPSGLARPAFPGPVAKRPKSRREVAGKLASSHRNLETVTISKQVAAVPHPLHFHIRLPRCEIVRERSWLNLLESSEMMSQLSPHG